MRDIGPFYFNRLEGEVIFVDPKAEMLRKDRRIVKSIDSDEHKRPNVLAIGTPGKGKMLRDTISQKGD